MDRFMEIAIEEARKGIHAGHGGPFGCVIVKDGEVVATGHSVQVFMDAKSHQLVLTSPDFYEEWKQRWEVNQ